MGSKLNGTFADRLSTIRRILAMLGMTLFLTSAPPSYRFLDSNYLTFDIIRRILEEYFGYEVFAVMNITDVDDKIIIKARKVHLFDNFVASNATLNDNAKQELGKAWPAHIESLKKKHDELTKKAGPKAKEDPEVLNAKERYDEAVANEVTVMKLLSASPVPAEEIYKLSFDALSDYLDHQLGGTVTDQKIFRDLASKYEAEYLQDMAKLGIRLPDVLTRVTEYIPEIIK
jgi:cysteinyl-tRNA synthetase